MTEERINQISTQILNHSLPLSEWESIYDEVYEMVARKIESEPNYEQSRHDIYGKVKRALRKVKREDWDAAKKILEE